MAHTDRDSVWPGAVVVDARAELANTPPVMLALRQTPCLLWLLAALVAGGGCDQPAGGGTNTVASSTVTGSAPAASASASAGAPAAASAVRAATERSAPLNVVVIMIDSLRADHLPFAGYHRPVAPHLTALAQESVVFSHFYSLSSYTAMTYGGFVAGRYPSEVARSGYFFSAYPEKERRFPLLLQRAKVRTLSAQAHWYFAKDKAGLHHGFDEWELVAPLRKSHTTDENITGEKLLAIALRQLGDEGNTAGRFFAWYHFMDPHDMYMGHPGQPKLGRGARGLYDGEILYADTQVGKLLDFIAAQSWGARTAVILSADHGEAFGEHGMYRHGFELWDVLIHVPLVVQLPGLGARTIDEPRGGVDLPPTILDLMGVPAPDWMQGHSLLGEVRGAKPERRAVISDLPRTSDNDRRRALIWGQYKLIAHGDDASFQLFDLGADPAEKHDLASKKPKLLEQLRRRYEKASEQIHDICPKMRQKLKGKKKGKPC